MEKMTAQEIEQKRAGEKEDEAGRTLRGVPPAAGVRRSSHGKMSVYGDEDVLQCL